MIPKPRPTPAPPVAGLSPPRVRRVVQYGVRHGAPGAVFCMAVCAAMFAPAFAEPPSPSDLRKPTREYFAYVCAESEDEVALVRFGPSGTEVSKRIPVGTFPAEIEGPHGINISPSGRYWYVSISHGQPFGSIHKFSTGDDEWIGSTKVGMFPATLDISPSTGLLYVVNSDFYGEHKPSSVSVVETATMTEVDQIRTGTMPHGARLSRNGRLLYSVNMMDDELVEIDAFGFTVVRRLQLPEKGIAGLTTVVATAAAASADHSMHQHPMAQGPHSPKVEPSWVTAPTQQGRVYVAGLSANALFEIDLQTFTVRRRFETAKGPYNAAVSPDGRLLAVTYKKSDAVGFWDLESGTEIANVATTRRIPHGVAITTDGRYSFFTVEGVGGEPGTVEVFDNGTQQRVGLIEIGKQAGGIAIWDPPR